ncbi:MAG: hypothetical protein GY754_30580 [bacterium]|nr:hypothetical protein [bacterium]
MNKIPGSPVIIALLLGMSLLSCSDMILAGRGSSDIPNKSGSKTIESFSFEAEKNESLAKDIHVFISGTEITAVVPYKTSPAALKATFQISGISLTVNGMEQESGVTENDFSSSLVYIVTAENNSTKTYRVRVLAESNPVQQYGASGDDEACDIVIDSKGSSYVVGSIGGNICLMKYNSLGAREWERTFGGIAWDFGRAVALDGHENIYIAGLTYGDLDGEGNSGGRDAVLIKCDPSGAIIWTRQLGSVEDEYATGLAIDAAGNITVVGNTEGVLEGIASKGGWDFFLARYNMEGERLWVHQYGSSQNDFVEAAAVNSQGMLYCTGYTDGELEAGNDAGGRDIFLAQYDAAGTEQWLRQLGSEDADEGYGVAVDYTDGSCYVTGMASGDFADSTNSGGPDMLLAKYGSNGERAWVRQTGTDRDECAYGAAVDSGGGVSIVGNSRGSMGEGVNAGNNDLVLVYYSSPHEEPRTWQSGSTGHDYGRGIAINNDRVHIAGFTEGDWDEYTNQGERDILFLRYFFAD